MIPRRLYAALAELRRVTTVARTIGTMLDEGDIVACATQSVLPAFVAEMERRDAEGCKTITLCGSTRFERVFDLWNHALSLSGHAVFGLGSRRGEMRVGDVSEARVAQMLDQCHQRKIDRSDAILVVNAFAYVGETTLDEIEYARRAGVMVYSIESWGKGSGVGPNHNAATQEAAALHGVPVGFGSPIDLTHDSRTKSAWDLLPESGSLRDQIVDTIQGFRRVYMGSRNT